MFVSPSGSKRQRLVSHTAVVVVKVALCSALICLATFLLCIHGKLCRELYNAADDPFTNPSESIDEEQLIEFQAKTLSAPVCSAIDPDEIGFTLVIQLSADRLSLMEYHCQRWPNLPISLAVAAKSSDRVLVKVLQSLGCNTDLVDLVVIDSFDDEEDFPVNELRNAALSQVKTSHAIFIDADFILSQEAHDILNLHRSVLAEDDHNAFVIPAFQLHKLCESESPSCDKMHKAILPKTREDLIELFGDISDNAAVTQFDSKSNNGGHGSTNYDAWLTQANEELVSIPCVSSPRYEPYLVVRYCQDLPPFQEVFRGYGQNKLSWMQHFRRSGYRLFQLPVFAVHFPHKPSPARRKWEKLRRQISSNNTEQKMLAVEETALAFRRWMEHSVPDETRTPDCSPQPQMRSQDQ